MWPSNTLISEVSQIHGEINWKFVNCNLENYNFDTFIEDADIVSVIDSVDSCDGRCFHFILWVLLILFLHPGLWASPLDVCTAASIWQTPNDISQDIWFSVECAWSIIAKEKLYQPDTYLCVIL